MYLRRAIEKKFRLPWKDISAEVLLGPLRMHNTEWYLNENAGEPKLAPRYDKDGKPVSQDVIGEKKGSIVAFYTSPAGAAITTIEDYGKFAADIVNGAGLPKQIFAEMVKPQVDLPSDQGMALAYGLGWVLVRNLSDGEYAMVHGGSEPGVRTFVVLLPKTKRGLVILTNGDNGFELCRKIVAAWPGVGAELVERLHGYL